MHLTEADLRALTPDTKRMVVWAGTTLFVDVKSVGRGAGMSFIGRIPFPPGRSGKEVAVRIGVYGR